MVFFLGVPRCNLFVTKIGAARCFIIFLWQNTPVLESRDTIRQRAVNRAAAASRRTNRSPIGHQSLVGLDINAFSSDFQAAAVVAVKLNIGIFTEGDKRFV